MMASRPSVSAPALGAVLLLAWAAPVFADGDAAGIQAAANQFIGESTAAVAAELDSTTAALGDIEGIPREELCAGGNEKMRYLLVGPRPDAPKPKEGFSLLVVLPGGEGGAEFSPFVQRVFANSLPDRYVVAQPIAVKWTDGQKVVWPTSSDNVPGQAFSTEAFVEAVIADVAKHRKVNPERIFVLAWSSGGPAAYSIALQEKTAVQGFFIAMSVFNPGFLPSLERARDKSFYIFHGTDDTVCPLWMARLAKTRLEAAGARVKLTEYSGGHGWRLPTVYRDIEAGIQWLEGPRPSQLPEIPFADSFESGDSAPTGWSRGRTGSTIKYEWDKANASDGEASLSISKTAEGYMPTAEWFRPFAYDGSSPKLSISVRAKADSVAQAAVDVVFEDSAGNRQHTWAVTIGNAYIRGPRETHNWKECSGVVSIPRNTAKILIGLQLRGPGKVWFDDLKLEYSK